MHYIVADEVQTLEPLCAVACDMKQDGSANVLQYCVYHKKGRRRLPFQMMADMQSYACDHIQHFASCA